MTRDEIDRIIGVLVQGRAVVCNVDFGYMVCLTPLPNGRARIDCPDEAPEIWDDQQAEHVRKVLASWQTRLTEWDMKGAGHVRH